MSYLLDTVAIVRHFTGEGRIGKSAAQILNDVDDNDAVLAVSVVSLIEILYLAEKRRIAVNLAETCVRPGSRWRGQVDAGI